MTILVEKKSFSDKLCQKTSDPSSESTVILSSKSTKPGTDSQFVSSDTSENDNSGGKKSCSEKLCQKTSDPSSESTVILSSKSPKPGTDVKFRLINGLN